MMIRMNVGSKRNYSRRLLFGMGLIFLFTLRLSAEYVTKMSILPIGAPIIKDKKVYYTVQFVFKKCPKNYWWYYDPPNKRMVIEFYDFTVKLADTFAISSMLPVKEITVANETTTMVLSGKKSQIQLGLKEEMQCDAHSANDTLFVTLWKKLSKKSASDKNQLKKRSILLPLIVAVLSSGITLSFLWYNNKF